MLLREEAEEVIKFEEKHNSKIINITEGFDVL